MSEQPFQVSTETLHALSARVGEASAAVAALRADPCALAGDLAHAGSPPLVAAAQAFGQAWSTGCAVLEHQTSLLSDLLRRAGDSYEVDERGTAEMLQAARWSGQVRGLEGL